MAITLMFVEFTAIRHKHAFSIKLIELVFVEAMCDILSHV